MRWGNLRFLHTPSTGPSANEAHDLCLSLALRAQGRQLLDVFLVHARLNGSQVSDGAKPLLRFDLRGPAG